MCASLSDQVAVGEMLMDDEAMMNEFNRRVMLVEEQIRRADSLEAERQIDAASAAYLDCFEIARREQVPLFLPQLVHIWMGMGFCQADRNQWSQALEMYHRAEITLRSVLAILSNPESPEVQEQAKQWTHYIPEGLQVVLPENYDPIPDLVNVFESIGLAHDNGAQLDRAQFYFEQAIIGHIRLNNPDGVLRVWNYRAVGCQRRQDWDNLRIAAENMLKVAGQQQHNLEARIVAWRYLSQARLNQNYIMDAIEYLALAVEAEQQAGHPYLAQDERLKADLVQSFGEILREQVSQFQPHRAMPPVDPAQFRPLSALFSQITLEQANVDGKPQLLFVVHTTQFDAAAQVLRLFPLSPLPVNLRSLREMGAEGLPDGIDLWIEWRLPDIEPDRPIGFTPIPLAQRDQLLALNGQDMQFSVVLAEDNQNRRRARLLYAPYLLDWYGFEGAAIIMRGSWRQPTREDVEPLVSWLNERIKAGGLATGLFTQIGFAYRMIGEWDRAIEYYLKELQVGLKPDGQPGRGVLVTLCNLGTVYKKKQDFDRARLCYQLALQMNPNYFEALISLPGIMEGMDWQLVCLSRAYRLRPDDPYVSAAVQNLCASWPHTYPDIWSLVQRISREIDLAQPFAALAVPDPAGAVRDLLSALAQPTVVSSGPLNTLEEAIRVLEQFAAAHMGSALRLSTGPGWYTSIEEQVLFHSDERGNVQTTMSPGAQLSLSLNPELMIRVTLQPPTCSVAVMEEFQIPNVPQSTLKSVQSKTIPARAETLWALLNQWINSGVLYQSAGRWHCRS